jgi:hypothetical protein
VSLVAAVTTTSWPASCSAKGLAASYSLKLPAVTTVAVAASGTAAAVELVVELPVSPLLLLLPCCSLNSRSCV